MATDALEGVEIGAAHRLEMTHDVGLAPAPCAEEIEDADPHDLAEKQAAGAMAEAGRLAEAVELLSGIGDPGLRDRGRLHVAMASALWGDLDTADEVAGAIAGSAVRHQAGDIVATAKAVAANRAKQLPEA